MAKKFRIETKDVFESTLYFILTVLLLLAVFIYSYRPFDPFPLRSRQETFLDPNETYIEDPTVRKNTLIPSGLQSDLPVSLAAYQEPTNNGPKNKVSGNRVSDSFLKSSFNSLWDGSKCSISMMTYVISRGCRFLDFEVYVHLDEKEESPRLVVAYGGNMRDNKSNLKHADVLSFAEVMKFVMSNAFSSTVTPVATDPLFLHFRLQIEKADSVFTTQQLVSVLKASVPSNRRMKTTEFANSSIGALRNKCGILFDTLTCPWIADVDTDGFQKIVTAYTGTDAFPLLKYGPSELEADESTDIVSNPNARKQGVKVVGVLAIPSRDSLNFMDAMFTSNSGSLGASFTMRSLTKHPSITFMALPFYQNNNALREYETFFNTQKTACATKTAAKAFVEELVGEI